MSRRRAWFAIISHRAGFSLFCFGLVSLTTGSAHLRLEGSAKIVPAVVHAESIALEPELRPVMLESMLIPTITPVPPTATPTLTPSATPTHTPSPTATPSATPSPTPSATPTMTPSPTATEAPPTATATDVPLSPPARLVIPKIGLDQEVHPVGTDSNGNLPVLKHDIAWYKQGGRPAGGTNIIFWAHVLRWKDSPTIPAPFADLHLLQVGNRVTLISNAGERFDYAVTQRVSVTPDQVEYLAPTNHEQVILITCTGDNVIVGGKLTKTQRLLIIAEPMR